MKKYRLEEKVGSGNFSSVHLARTVEDDEKIAIKVMKSHHNIGLREAYLLKKLNHPNIIRLIDFYQDPSLQETHLVLQYLPQNTLELYETQGAGLSEEQVKCILFQTTLGLTYIHERGIIHRDLKPENILIDKTKPEIKIIDFGLAVKTDRVSTDYVATRWYRAPENLLGTKEYTTAIDVFSMGCVIVELMKGVPLFPGTDNVDQLFKIISVLGEPTETSWPLGYKKYKELGIQSQFRKDGLSANQVSKLHELLQPCNEGLFNLIQRMLILDPLKRITCKQIVMDPYFKSIRRIVPSEIYRRFEEDHLLKKCGSLELIPAIKYSLKGEDLLLSSGQMGGLRSSKRKSEEPQECSIKVDSGMLSYMNELKDLRSLEYFDHKINTQIKKSGDNSREITNLALKSVRNKITIKEAMKKIVDLDYLSPSEKNLHKQEQNYNHKPNFYRKAPILKKQIDQAQVTQIEKRIREKFKSKDKLANKQENWKDMNSVRYNQENGKYIELDRVKHYSDLMEQKSFQIANRPKQLTMVGSEMSPNTKKTAHQAQGIKVTQNIKNKEIMTKSELGAQYFPSYLDPNDISGSSYFEQKDFRPSQIITSKLSLNSKLQNELSENNIHSPSTMTGHRRQHNPLYSDEINAEKLSRNKSQGYTNLGVDLASPKSKIVSSQMKYIPKSDGNKLVASKSDHFRPAQKAIQKQGANQMKYEGLQQNEHSGKDYFRKYIGKQRQSIHLETKLSSDCKGIKYNGGLQPRKVYITSVNEQPKNNPSYQYRDKQSALMNSPNNPKSRQFEDDRYLLRDFHSDRHLKESKAVMPNMFGSGRNININLNLNINELEEQKRLQRQ